MLQRLFNFVLWTVVVFATGVLGAKYCPYLEKYFGPCHGCPCKDSCDKSCDKAGSTAK